MDEHDADVFELVKRYGALEFERGQMLADIAFHLKLRAVAAKVDGPPATLHVVNHRQPRAKRSDLREAILQAVDQHGTRSAKELADDVGSVVNNVRAATHKMVAQGLLVKEGQTYRRHHPV